MDTELSILPHVLAVLSRKPDRLDYIDDLCEEVEDIIAAEYPNAKAAHLRKAIKKALKDGEELGIISIGPEMIRLPFKLGGNQSPVLDAASDDIMDDSMDDDEHNATNKTSRRKSSLPRKRATLEKDDGPRINVGKTNHTTVVDRMGRTRSAKARRPRRGRASSRRRVSRRRASTRRR